MLRKGVDVWNKWREKHGDVKLDLHAADLVHAHLRRVQLRGVNLSLANLHVADLRDADLRGTDLSRADLSRADLRRANLIGANLMGANLIGANLSKANLNEANLSRAELGWAQFREADLRMVDFEGANLSGAYLSYANLGGAHFRGACLLMADLDGTKLIGTDLTRASLGWTKLGEVDLREVKGLETVHHDGPSTIGIDTAYRSTGGIPEAFLRGAGVPDDFIDHMKSLAGHASEFPSCFISYSNRDHEFAEQLYADLQNKGVRCWFAPEDMKIGDQIVDRIDQSIKLHDKLLLILSHSSIGSTWVQKEVETAFQEETKRKQLILFPLRLDESVVETSQPWAADLHRLRHIGDFRDWKDHDSYQKAFNRLLRDLKTAAAKREDVRRDGG
jgi:uncharacterized protein YjbI with pentapeptide repeats